MVILEHHAEYILKCRAAAEWLNTPEPVAGVPKEFLDAARATRSDAAGKGDARLLYCPVDLCEHFMFGIVLGCPAPCPDAVDAAAWVPLVNRFVLDAARKCFMMFSYFAEGSIVVTVAGFDHFGDHFSELTYFEPTPVVGVFPRGIRGRVGIAYTKDCPACTRAAVPCACAKDDRIAALTVERRRTLAAPETLPAHAAVTYSDSKVHMSSYPYWAQMLDEFINSRVGSFSGLMFSEFQPGPSRRERYHSVVSLEPRAAVENTLLVMLYDKGVTALKPPVTDVHWVSSSTVSVNSANVVKEFSRGVTAACPLMWHKLPGFQDDYLLVAPSNIVSSARAREELASAEALRRVARAQRGVPMLPSWASGAEAIFAHALAAVEAEPLTLEVADGCDSNYGFGGQRGTMSASSHAGQGADASGLGSASLAWKRRRSDIAPTVEATGDSTAYSTDQIPHHSGGVWSSDSELRDCKLRCSRGVDSSGRRPDTYSTPESLTLL